MEKVLIGIVTYDGKNYCLPKFAAFLRTITYPKFDIVFLDNSENRRNLKFIEKEGFNAVWIRHGSNEQEIMANCNEWLRKYAIEHQFDYMLSLESDVFPCPDFVEIMLSYHKPVIGLPYFIGQSFMSYLLQFQQEEMTFDRQLIPMSNARSFFISNGKLRRAMQIGLGCLLMSNYVLKHISFKISSEYPLYHADSSLHIQLQQFNIPVYFAPDYICVHENKSHNVLFTEYEHQNSGQYKDYEDN